MKWRGSILVATLATVLFLVSLVGSFLFAAGTLSLNSGWGETDALALWLAEAGLQKAIRDLKTPTPQGRGENWTTTGTTEALGGGSYTMVVSRYDFALAANGSTASASSSNGVNAPSRAIDGNGTTFWESAAAPTATNPQFITIQFPYPLSVNKVSLSSSLAAARPRDYSWQVSTDGSSFTTVVSVMGNTGATRIDVFVAQSNVRHLRLRVTKPGKAGTRVRINLLEAIGSKIASTGTITATSQTVTRTITQTVVADDGSPENQKAYYEPDWAE